MALPDSEPPRKHVDQPTGPRDLRAQRSASPLINRSRARPRQTALTCAWYLRCSTAKQRAAGSPNDPPKHCDRTGESSGSRTPGDRRAPEGRRHPTASTQPTASLSSSRGYRKPRAPINPRLFASRNPLAPLQASRASLPYSSSLRRSAGARVLRLPTFTQRLHSLQSFCCARQLPVERGTVEQDILPCTGAVQGRATAGAENLHRAAPAAAATLVLRNAARAGETARRSITRAP